MGKEQNPQHKKNASMQSPQHDKYVANEAGTVGLNQLEVILDAESRGQVEDQIISIMILTMKALITISFERFKEERQKSHNTSTNNINILSHGKHIS